MKQLLILLEFINYTFIDSSLQVTSYLDTITSFQVKIIIINLIMRNYFITIEIPASLASLQVEEALHLV